MREVIKLGFNGSVIDAPFVVTTAAPEDHIPLHPEMLRRILNTISVDGLVDIFKSQE